ncbi:M23 family metallopeptidase [Pedococcus sp. 5OH_020]|uniref:M23 family metallopeptidase n=1 Tax=Pedococcus sp. 5OH_020 TaxID=2989814 RepID=UPI0022EA0BC0|nr:M23 family metallopeptidase [Pedococcus sp. 5OH_020]
MSANSPRRPVRLAVRATIFGLAAACCVGLAPPSLAASPASTGILSGVMTGEAASPVARTLTGMPAATDPDKAKKQVDREVAALKNQLEDTSSSLQAAYVALRQTQAQLPAAQKALDRATSAQAQADAFNDDMAVALAVAEANEARAVDQLDGTRRSVVDSRTRIARFASQLYQDQGMGQLSVALNATSPEDFASRIALTDTVMDVQHQSLTRLATAQADATAQEAHLKALQAQVEASKKAAEAALAKATLARAEAASAKQALDSLAARQAAQSRALEAQKAAENRQLSKARQEQARLQKVLIARAKAAKAAAARRAAALRRAGRKVPPPPRADNFLSAPSDGWISSEFGMRFHPILHYWRLHAGRDFAADCGTPIRAAAPGQIISAGWGGGYGNRIMLDHGIVRGVDLVTTYNHMSRYTVRSGQVSRGQVIGYVGTTGSSTGCHLHFETYEDGIPKDPRRWL